MEMMKRAVNVGFSGGEKKRNEMVQMGILDPRLAVLDETDSGLDIDALRVVGAGINAIMRRPDKGVLLITHYQRLLDYVGPISSTSSPAAASSARAAPSSRTSSRAKAMGRWRRDVLALPSAPAKRLALERSVGAAGLAGAVDGRVPEAALARLREGPAAAVRRGALPRARWRSGRCKSRRATARAARRQVRLVAQARPRSCARGLVQIVHVSTGAADHSPTRSCSTPTPRPRSSRPSSAKDGPIG